MFYILDLWNAEIVDASSKLVEAKKQMINTDMIHLRFAQGSNMNMLLFNQAYLRGHDSALIVYKLTHAISATLQVLNSNSHWPYDQFNKIYPE